MGFYCWGLCCWGHLGVLHLWGVVVGGLWAGQGREGSHRHRVVQQSRDDRLLVHLGPRKDDGDLDWVGDVRLSAAPLLAVVGQKRRLECETDLRLSFMIGVLV